MRCLLVGLLLSCCLLAQNPSSNPQPSPPGGGMFYVDGIVYHYVAGTSYTVVAAAHSVLNRKFLAVKVRVYNAGRESVTVKPETSFWKTRTEATCWPRCRALTSPGGCAVPTIGRATPCPRRRVADQKHPMTAPSLPHNWSR